MKRIDTSDIKKIIELSSSKDNEVVFHYSDDKGFEKDIIVFKTIPTSLMIEFVDTVVDKCFVDETFRPLNVDIIYDRCLLAYYTNLEYVEKDDKDTSIEDLIYKSDIVRKIKSSIDSYQKSIIDRGIKSAVEFKRQEVLSSQKKRLENLINGVATEQAEIISEIKKIITLFNDNFSGVDFDLDKLERILDKANSIDKDNLSKNIISNKEKWCQVSSNLEQQIKNYLSSKLAINSKQAKGIESLLLGSLREQIDSTSAFDKYPRVRQLLLHSISSNITQNKNSISVGVNFNDSVYRKSLYPEKYQGGYIDIFWNNGWSAKGYVYGISSSSGKRIRSKRFFPQTNFIQDTAEQCSKDISNFLGKVVRVEINEDYASSSYRGGKTARGLLTSKW